MNALGDLDSLCSLGPNSLISGIVVGSNEGHGPTYFSLPVTLHSGLWRVISLVSLPGLRPCFPYCKTVVLPLECAVKSLGSPVKTQIPGHWCILTVRLEEGPRSLHFHQILTQGLELWDVLKDSSLR